MASPERRVADQLFSAGRAEQSLERFLEQMFGAPIIRGEENEWRWPFRDWHWDDYDASLELTIADPAFNLSDEQQAKLWAEGFARCWVTRTDDTCTYYGPGHGPHPSHPSVARECSECGESKATKWMLADARRELAVQAEALDKWRALGMHLLGEAYDVGTGDSDHIGPTDALVKEAMALLALPAESAPTSEGEK